MVYSLGKSAKQEGERYMARRRREESADSASHRYQMRQKLVSISDDVTRG